MCQVFWQQWSRWLVILILVPPPRRDKDERKYQWKSEVGSGNSHCGGTDPEAWLQRESEQWVQTRPAAGLNICCGFVVKHMITWGKGAGLSRSHSSCLPFFILGYSSDLRYGLLLIFLQHCQRNVCEVLTFSNICRCHNKGFLRSLWKSLEIWHSVDFVCWLCLRQSNQLENLVQIK